MTSAKPPPSLCVVRSAASLPPTQSASRSRLQMHWAGSFSFLIFFVCSPFPVDPAARVTFCLRAVWAVSRQRCISRQARCASNHDALGSPILNTALPFGIASLPRYSYRLNTLSSRVRIFTAEGRPAETRLALSTITSLHPAVPRSFGLFDNGFDSPGTKHTRLSLRPSR
jgi:hypothetical protein